MISVVIPVYNCEKYLHDSIKSLVNQTIFDKLELVFVDDGSTDNSRDIIKKYVNIYDNMKLVVQDNMGVSVARNRGIKESKGEYVCFFDADDLAEPRLYEKLYKLLIENDADISIVDYSMLFENGIEKKHRPSVFEIWDSKDESLKKFFVGKLICTNPVDKMFSRKILDNITFPIEYAIGEDMYFVYNAIKKSNRVVIDSTSVMYKYRIHPESAMKKEFSEKHIGAVKLAEKILSDFERGEFLYDYAEANYVHEICKMFGLMYRKNQSLKKFANKTKIYKTYMKQYSIIKAFKYMEQKHVMALILMKISPRLYTLVYKMMKVG